MVVQARLDGRRIWKILIKFVLLYAMDKIKRSDVGNYTCKRTKNGELLVSATFQIHVISKFSNITIMLFVFICLNILTNSNFRCNIGGYIKCIIRNSVFSWYCEQWDANAQISGIKFSRLSDIYHQDILKPKHDSISFNVGVYTGGNNASRTSGYIVLFYAAHVLLSYIKVYSIFIEIIFCYTFVSQRFSRDQGLKITWRLREGQTFLL